MTWYDVLERARALETSKQILRACGGRFSGPFKTAKCIEGASDAPRESPLALERGK